MAATGSTPLIVLGGTFDPPHLGHLVLAECAAHQFGGPVVFMPAGDPWRKTAAESAPRDVSPAGHRLAMTRLAIEGNSAFRLDDREARRDGPTYTVDTLRELHEDGYRNIVLILGADALDDLPNWQSPAEIRALATLAVAPRDESGPARATGVVTIDMPPLAISSTHIRERVAAGKPIRYLVPPVVETYIVEQQLYRR
jgi:nicotinate-nucleotide adenylyltransferase